MQKKNNIQLRVIIDTREQDVAYVKKILNSKVDSTGILLNDFKIDTCKPLGKDKSVGDITYQYTLDGEKWYDTNLCIEIKKGMDLFQTLWSNGKRFKEEIKRTDGLDFYIIHDWTMYEVVNGIKELILKKFIRNNSNAVEGFLGSYLKLCKDHTVICSGSNKNDLSKLIRRIIKEHFKINRGVYNVDRPVENIPKKIEGRNKDVVKTTRRRRTRRTS